MGELFARAGVLFGGLGVLLLILLGGGNSTPEDNPIRIVTPMVESLEDGQCPNGTCIAGLTLTDPITGNIETIRVGMVNPETISYSPDYTQISYFGLFNLYVLNLQTRRLRVLATGVSDNYTFSAWSPDSTQIAYISTQGLAIVNVNSGVQRRIRHVDGTGQIDWSPDGTRLLFSGTPLRRGNETYLYILNLITGELTNLTPDRPYSYSASWSPDGSEIVFIIRGWRSTSRDLFIINADGTHMRRITFNRSDYIGRPRWIRDGTAIFYFEINNYQLDLETQAQQRFDRNYKSSDADISPDESQFVRIQNTNHLLGDYRLTIYDFHTQNSYELPLKTYLHGYAEWGS